MAEKDLPEIILKILETLTEEKVPFLIVGGLAMALHGIPRSTLDIDIVLPAKTETLINFFKIAAQIGLESKEKDIMRLANRPELLIGQWITFHDSKKREIVDIFFETPGSFKKRFSRATKKVGERITCYVASLKDIEKMKKDSGRPIDLADLVLIKERRQLNRKKVKEKEKG